MRHEIPPWPVHLGPTLRRSLDQLPVEAAQALGLDHLRSVEGLDATLWQALEEALAEFVGAIDDPADRELERLEILPPAARADEIRSAAPDAYASVRLAGLLRDKAFAALPVDPEAAVHWSELCGLVARRGSTPAHRDWQVRWLYLVANAHRARQEFAEAERWFERAAAEGRTVSRNDLELAEEQYTLVSSWQLDRGDLRGALTAASRSARLAKIAGQPHRQGRALLVSGPVFHHAGQYRQMVSDARAAIDCFEPRMERPLLALMARFNLALAWVECGHPLPARGVLLKARALFDLFPQHYVHLRRRWLEARIAAALREMDEAMVAYRETIEGFLEAEARRDAVHATVDLATFLRLDLDHDALRKLSTSVLPRLRAALDEDTPANERAVVELLHRATTEPEAVRLGELIRAVALLRDEA